MEKEEFYLLAEKIYEGTASKEEIAKYNHYYMYFQKDTEWNDVLGSQKFEGEEIYNNINAAISENKNSNYRRWIAIAATIAIILSAGLYFYLPFTSDQLLISEEPGVVDIKPGGDKAILTLADGSQIILDQATNGEIAEQGGVRISKSEDGLIIYEVGDIKGNPNGSSTAFNTISTPRGGQYKVVLPDGSLVWLNAASSLKYPAKFDLDKRSVELTGEAYFEVAHRTNDGAKMPFIVSTDNQEVEVLGTHFNISSYAEDKVTKTTLLEGSVRVHLKLSKEVGLNKESKSVLLKPNQQSILSSDRKRFTVADVNTEESVAWKNGLFIFNDESLQSIMKKISRWYDVDVVFKGADPDRIYWGSVSRFENVSEVLNKLELTGSVRFEIESPTGKGEERRIVVMK